MPKKPPRDNRGPRELRTVHSAGAGAAALLQRITKQAGVRLPAPSPGHPPAPEDWLARLRTALPAELRPHLARVLEKDDGLVLFAASAAWAGRIRLELPALDAVAGGKALKLRIEPVLRAR